MIYAEACRMEACVNLRHVLSAFSQAFGEAANKHVWPIGQRKSSLWAVCQTDIKPALKRSRVLKQFGGQGEMASHSTARLQLLPCG